MPRWTGRRFRRGGADDQRRARFQPSDTGVVVITVSVRESIMQAIGTRLTDITTGNGYQTNLGNNVYEWRETKLEQSELPAVIIRDPNSETTPLTYSKHRHLLGVEIEVAAAGSGNEPPQEMRKLLADLKKAVGVDETWGGLAEGTEILEEDIVVTQLERELVGIRMVLAVEYTTNRWDEYQ